MSTAAQQLEQHLQQQLGTILYGMEEAIHGLAIALVAQGHVLVEGAPGLGKTLLAKALAAVRGGSFKRIQCTADMMPSDMTGIHVFDAEDNRFRLLKGPMFVDVLLADEINRTGPKTQSALLEAMEERSVTLDRETYDLPAEFQVVATQNPLDFEGVYPLPESQLDRFLLRLLIDYPEMDAEMRVLQEYDHPGGGHTAGITDLQPLAPELLAQARQEASGVHVSESLYRYATELAAASRNHPGLSLGLSTRASLAVMRCARVEAAMRNAEFVTPDDIKMVARQVVPHRLLPTPEASLEGLDGERIFEQILTRVEAPRSAE
jgi:MoxR-like ATPase